MKERLLLLAPTPRDAELGRAILAEAGSLWAYALIVRELLRIGDVRARLSALVRATLGGVAMSASLPGGQLASAAYWYRELREEGASRSLTALAMFGSMIAFSSRVKNPGLTSSIVAPARCSVYGRCAYFVL